MKVTIVILRVADLGFAEAATTSQIIGTDHDTDQDGNSAPFTGGRGRQLGLELCPSDFGPQFILQDKKPPLDEPLYVAMKPIASSDGEPRIFVLGHNADGFFLDASLARPNDKWHPNKKFLFCVPS